MLHCGWGVVKRRLLRGGFCWYESLVLERRNWGLRMTRSVETRLIRL